MLRERKRERERERRQAVWPKRNENSTVKWSTQASQSGKRCEGRPEEFRSTRLCEKRSQAVSLMRIQEKEILSLSLSFSLPLSSSCLSSAAPGDESIHWLFLSHLAKPATNTHTLTLTYIYTPAHPVNRNLKLALTQPKTHSRTEQPSDALRKREQGHRL